MTDEFDALLSMTPSESPIGETRINHLEQTMAWVLEWIRSGQAGAPTDGLDAEREQRIAAAC